jgi:hypothetical protein
MVAVAAVLTAGNILAQDTVTAEALFNRAVQQMDAGKYAEACPALQESYRLDPKAGALFALADCNKHWGKVATAVAHYEDYIGLVMRLPAGQQGRHEDRIKIARDELATLRPSVPELTLVLAADAPKNTVVRRDGVELGAAVLGVGLPVDPGEHVITTQVAEGPVRTVRVTVALRDKKRVELGVDLPVRPAAQGSASASGALAGPPAASSRQASSNGASTRTAAWIAGGIGAAGLLAGAVTGVMVFAKKGTISDNCDGPACNTQGKSAADSAQTLATVSTVCFGVGIAGAGTAIVLMLLQSGKPKESARRGWIPLVASDGSGAWLGTGTRW